MLRKKATALRSVDSFVVVEISLSTSGAIPQGFTPTGFVLPTYTGLPTDHL